MDWRTFILGVIVTLAVSIISGIFVVYITRDKPAPVGARVVYRIASPTVFESATTQLTIHGVDIANEGDTISEDVKIAIRVSEDTIVLDKDISFSTGPVSIYDYNDIPGKGFDIHIPIFIPQESVHISYLIDGISPVIPDVFVRSRETIGEEVSYQPGKPPLENEESISRFLEIMLPILLILQVGAFSFLIVRRFLPRYQRNLNNMAFVLLHQNARQEAEEILDRQIRNIGGGSHELSNYALCKALSKNFEISNVYIKSADFFATTPLERAIVAFNRSLIDFLRGDTENGKKNLYVALKIKKKEILKYIAFSEVISELRKKSSQNDGAFREALAEIGRSKSKASK